MLWFSFSSLETTKATNWFNANFSLSVRWCNISHVKVEVGQSRTRPATWIITIYCEVCRNAGTRNVCIHGQNIIIIEESLTHSLCDRRRAPNPAQLDWLWATYTDQCVGLGNSAAHHCTTNTIDILSTIQINYPPSRVRHWQVGREHVDASDRQGTSEDQKTHISPSNFGRTQVRACPGYIVVACLGQIMRVAW